MRTIFTTTVSILILFSQIQQVLAQSDPLNGPYTIGSGGYYPTVTAAIDSLVSNGINGPVLFNIKNGSYNEQISIPEIAGSSADNTITFQSETGDSTQVKIYFACGYNNNYIIKLNGADHFLFRKLTIEAVGSDYGRAIVLDSGANNNRFESSIIRNQNYGNGFEISDENTLVYANSGYNSDYNSFINNIFENGTYAFFYTNSIGTTIDENLFINQTITCLYLQYHESLIITMVR